MKIRYAKLSIQVLLLWMGKVALAQTYNVAQIPPALKENADAVVRMHETVFTVKTAGEAVEKVRYAVTIFHEKAKDHASIAVPYDKLSKVNYLQGAIYDAYGKQVDKLKKSEIHDMSAISDISVFEDSRMKAAGFERNEYPYTVEFEYETTTKNTLFYPSWFPQRHQYLSIEKASFQVHMPKGLTLRYKEIDLPGKAVINETEGLKTYSWELKSLTAREREVYSPISQRRGAGVYVAPTEFEVEGYKGTMNSWNEFGKFNYTLNAGRDVLPENIRQQILQLTDKETDPVKKIQKVYEYLQANTRYVSIQLGIGGWQTFEAKTVADKGYGDCKALSNYAKAMLQAAGIESYVALIRAGRNESDIVVDFPSTQFNHAIVCVPLKKDTVWLECTSQTESVGYMGNFTGNRHALLITPQGGKLVKTPAYKAKDNQQLRKAEVFVNEQGDATAEITTLYSGIQQEEVNNAMHSLTPEDQKKWLYKNVKIPSFEVAKFSFSEQKGRIPAVTEKLSLKVRKCVSKSGTRIFLTPNLLSVWTSIPPSIDNRKSEVETSWSFEDADTIVYHLPKGYGIEHLPEPIQFQTKFGTYTASIKEQEGTVFYTRRVSMDQGRFPASAYNELIDFYKKVAKSDKTQMVLVNKNL